jgi:hypothetical protein
MAEQEARGRTHWRKSTRSNGSGECVEVAELGHDVAVRDSRDPDGAVLSFSPEAWRSFVEAVKRGEFDRE